ncbi:hypothetical protein DN068_20030 [Taibaiella soli]|uniref:Uncharacterized protein n=1 Tax=Taibaiella soli TaxID=1649169 RepID=A0A2W2BBI0_9BACT|nr:hypothetical protein DN068_20030 [Taibaiella soli]
MKQWPKNVWKMPAMMALCFLIGLPAALMGNLFGHFVAWTALLIPLLVVFFKIRNSKRKFY